MEYTVHNVGFGSHHDQDTYFVDARTKKFSDNTVFFGILWKVMNYKMNVNLGLAKSAPQIQYHVVRGPFLTSISLNIFCVY